MAADFLSDAHPPYFEPMQDFILVHSYGDGPGYGIAESFSQGGAMSYYRNAAFCTVAANMIRPHLPYVAYASKAHYNSMLIGGLYPPPQIPCGVHVESRSIPRVHVDFRHFFFAGSPANLLSRIHVESMWSPVGLQLLHLDNMDSTSEHRNSTSKTPYGVHMDYCI